MIAGVAGGIARHFGYDPALVRLAIATLGIITFGTVFVAYAVAWIVIPRDDGQLVADELRDHARDHGFRYRGSRRGRRWIGIAFFAFGLIALSDMSGSWPSNFVGPLILIAIGAALLFRPEHDHGSNTRAPATDTADHADQSDDHPTLSSFPETVDRIREQAERDAFSRYEARRRRRHERRSPLGRIVLSAICVFLGSAGLLEATGALKVNPGFVNAAVLTIAGIGLIIGAFVGRARVLIPLCIVLAFACAVSSAFAIPWRGGVGERTFQPRSTAEIPTKYELAMGKLNVDLHNLQTKRPTTVHARVGFGQLVITVPANASVRGEARIDAGTVTTLGVHDDGGVDQRKTISLPGTGPTITIDARLGAGEIAIRRAPSEPTVGTQGDQS